MIGWNGQGDDSPPWRATCLPMRLSHVCLLVLPRLPRGGLPPAGAGGGRHTAHRAEEVEVREAVRVLAEGHDLVHLRRGSGSGWVAGRVGDGGVIIVQFAGAQ